MLVLAASVAIVAALTTTPAIARTADESGVSPALAGAVTGRLLIEPFGGGTPVVATSGEVQFWSVSGGGTTPTATVPISSSGDFFASGLAAGSYRVAFISRDGVALPVREWNGNSLYAIQSTAITLVNGVGLSMGTVVLEERTVGADRYFGASRYGTAAAISERFASVTGRTVVIVNGLNFPDALGAGPLASRLGAPLLMVTATSIPPETAEQLVKLAPSAITIVGGTGVVSSAVEAQLAAYVGGAENVSRIAGASRYETSQAILASIGLSGTPVTRLFVATGRSFPDALAAVPAAVRVGGAVVLVDGARSSLDATTATFIDSANVPVTIVGGTGVVSSGIKSQLEGLGISVNRVAGANRYATSIAIGEQFFPYAEFAYLANGSGFADALSIGPWAGLGRVPVYLTQSNCVTDAVFDHIIDELYNGVVLVGGTGVLSENVKQLQPCSF